MKKLLILCLWMASFNAIPAQTLHKYSTLDHLLELKWEQDFQKKDLSFYDELPLIKNDILFHRFDLDYAIDILSGKKLFFINKSDQHFIKDRIKDSLLFYDTKNKVIVKDIYDGNILLEENKNAAYLGFENPEFLHDSLLYYLEDYHHVLALNAFSKKEIWQFYSTEELFTKPVEYGRFILVCTEDHLLFLDKETGKKMDSLLLGGSVNSSLFLFDDVAYIWTEVGGLKAIDLVKRSVIWAALKQAENPYVSLNILHENNALFVLVDAHIYKLNEAGEVLWDAKEGDADYQVVSLHPEYIFYYIKAGEHDTNLLCAFDRKSQKIAYAGFTSDAFPQSSLQSQSVFNELDESVLSLNRYTYHNLLIGVSQNKIYCFEIKK